MIENDTERYRATSYHQLRGRKSLTIGSWFRWTRTDYVDRSVWTVLLHALKISLQFSIHLDN